MIAAWFSRFVFFLRGKKRSEVDEELQFHLDRQIEANLASGMSIEEARRRAAVAFGGRQKAREQCRQERPSWGLEAVLRDLRFGLRGLMRNPGLALVAILTLAITIGANSAIFSLVSQALLRSLPVRDPQELVVLSFAGTTSGHIRSYGNDQPGHQHEFSYPMYRDLRDRNSGLSGLMAAAPAQLGVTWNKHSEAVSAEMVSGNYFDVLGVRPAIGRLFGAGDETAPGADSVFVLSFDYWKNHMGAAQVIGNTLAINGIPFTIAGVAAPGFRSMIWGEVPQLYVPVTMQHALQPEWDHLSSHHDFWLILSGRLQPGMTRVQAGAAINQVFLGLRADEFKTAKDQSAKARQDFVTKSYLHLEDGGRGFSPYREEIRTPLLIIMGMVLLVIAMAVVNVASLLLVRGASRRREFSVRYALGASSGQVLRQLLCEGLLLGLTGAGLGLLLAPEALQLLIHWMSAGAGDEPAFSPLLDWRVFSFTFVLTVMAGLLFSLAPALQFWNPRLAEALKQQNRTGSGGSLRFRRACVGMQIGVSFLLIMGAAMFVRTIQNLRTVDPGFQTEHLLAFKLNPALAGYPTATVAPIEQRAIDSIANLPGIHAVGATDDADLAGDDKSGDLSVSGYTPKPDEEFDVELPWVSNGYLQTLGIPLVAGRLFQPSDSATSQKVAVVNERFVRHYFHSPQAALGQHVSRPGRPATDAMIVGVVADVKHASVREAPTATCYTLFQQAERATPLTIYVRTWEAEDAAARDIRAAISNLDQKLMVSEIRTMRDQIDQNILAERTIALLATLFGGVAALLAGIGLYGILAYSTAQRTREIGIRMALGAHRWKVVGLVLHETLFLAACSVGVTIPIVLVATRAVRNQLFGVSMADPLVYTLGILAIGLVAMAAGFIPARRAASVDPSRALRTE